MCVQGLFLHKEGWETGLSPECPCSHCKPGQWALCPWQPSVGNSQTTNGTWTDVAPCLSLHSFPSRHSDPLCLDSLFLTTQNLGILSCSFDSGRTTSIWEVSSFVKWGKHRAASPSMMVTQQSLSLCLHLEAGSAWEKRGSGGHVSRFHKPPVLSLIRLILSHLGV